jgi:hypothetical protein
MRHFGERYSSRSRMPARLSQALENSIGGYVLAATTAGVATLALAIPAEGAPVCKNLSAVLNYTATFAFSPARQSVAPFNVAQSFHTFSTLTSTGINRGFFTPNLPGAEMALSSKGMVSGLASGAKIGPGGRFGRGAMYGLIFTFIPDYGATSQHHLGNLRFGQTNYFGFKFLASGQAHYGWLRMESKIVRGRSTPSVETNIMAYGYESTPNTGIPAGSCTAAASGPTAVGSAPSGDNADASEVSADDVAQPAVLGALALGAQGIPLWRK